MKREHAKIYEHNITYLATPLYLETPLEKPLLFLHIFQYKNDIS